MHVTIGAGPLGRGVALELVRRGERVRVLSRSGTSVGPDVESVKADAKSSVALTKALRSASVVYKCSQPPYTRWAQEFPGLQKSIVDATAHVGADLVVADNLYCYGDPRGAVITESSPEIPTSKKGTGA